MIAARNFQNPHSKESPGAVYSTMSGGVVSPGAPACTSGRSCIIGHCLRRGRTPASKALTTPALDDALFFCPQPETERRAA